MTNYKTFFGAISALNYPNCDVIIVFIIMDIIFDKNKLVVHSGNSERVFEGRFHRSMLLMNNGKALNCKYIFAIFL